MQIKIVFFKMREIALDSPERMSLGKNNNNDSNKNKTNKPGGVTRGKSENCRVCYVLPYKPAHMANKNKGFYLYRIIAGRSLTGLSIRVIYNV